MLIRLIMIYRSWAVYPIFPHVSFGLLFFFFFFLQNGDVFASFDHTGFDSSSWFW